MRVIHRNLKKATATRRGRIIVLSILLLILAGIAGGIIYWQTHKKQIIRNKLESAIREKSGGLYRIHYDALELDEITGNLAIRNISLTYDSLKYDSLRQLEKTPPILLNIRIPEISITGVQTPRALIDKEIKGKKLEIRNPVIEIIYTMQGKDSASNVPDREVYEQILGNLDMINVDSVTINGAHIFTRNLKTKQKGIEISNAYVQLTDLKIDSTSSEDSTRLLFSRQVAAGAESLSWRSAEQPYRFDIKNISFSSHSNMVIVRSFQIDPLLGEDAFVKSLPTQDDRFDFSFQNIIIKNVDFYKLLEEDIRADSMLISSSSFKIYRDLNIPRDKKNRIGTYPSQIVMKLPLPVDIKKIILKNAYVEYKEKNHITKKAGRVRFHGVYATISNLTNKRNTTMDIDITTRFQNKAPFKLSWTFYMGNPNGRFDVKGTLSSMNAEDLNELTEPMGPARIEKGIIKSLDFDLEGNNTSMTGTIRLLYDNLKIGLLEKDKGATEWDKKSLTSFVANLFIKNSNPRDEDEAPIVKPITNQRDINRSIFHLTWKTIFKGSKETMGIKK